MSTLVMGCSQPAATPTPASSSFTVTSPAFQSGDTLPAKYTADGADVSPPLSWSGAPAGTVSFVVVMDDPDAPGGGFTHWIVFNIAGNVTGLPEGVPQQSTVSVGQQGMNDFRNIGYDGPAPPPGSPHHYRFTVYALDSEIGRLPDDANLVDVMASMQGHILAQDTLTGLYGR